MTKYYEKTVRRPYQKDWLDAWAKAESSLGLKNSFFLIKNGMVEQYVDGDEGEKFHDYVRNLSEDEFDKICEDFFIAIEKKDKVDMFKALIIFDEMDNYNLGTDYMQRRLMRVRESTHEVSYKM